MPLVELQLILTPDDGGSRPHVKAELGVGPIETKADKVSVALGVLSVVEQHAVGGLRAE